ncbi:MAG: hypothetical protein V9H69_24865 [Anaerolineae bacterium]
MATTTLPRLPGVYFLPPAQPALLTLPRLDVAAFVGFAQRGPLHTPVALEDVDTYRALFGGDVALARDAEPPVEAASTVRAHLPEAVAAFFRNGGRRCYAVRVAGNTAASARAARARSGGAGQRRQRPAGLAARRVAGRLVEGSAPGQPAARRALAHRRVHGAERRPPALAHRQRAAGDPDRRPAAAGVRRRPAVALPGDGAGGLVRPRRAHLGHAGQQPGLPGVLRAGRAADGARPSARLTLDGVQTLDVRRRGGVGRRRPAAGAVAARTPPTSSRATCCGWTLAGGATVLWAVASRQALGDVGSPPEPLVALRTESLLALPGQSLPAGLPALAQIDRLRFDQLLWLGTARLPAIG